MKKLILMILCVVFLSACTSPTHEPVYTEKSGVVQGVTTDTITVKNSDGTFEIENHFGKTDFRGREIKITYKDGILENITLGGNHFESKAEEMLSTMTLEEKIGQMFLVRYPNDDTTTPIADYHIGGYILFARDFENETPETIPNKISNLQSTAKIPLLIAVDEEGGKVNRISKFAQFREEPFKSPSELYEAGGFDLIKSDTREKSIFLNSLHINVNLAPVCDISENESDYIHSRTIGLDKDGTSQYVKTVVDEMNSVGIGSVLKHFPGYGSNVDTHKGIAIDNRPYENFLNNDFAPFIAGIEAGCDSILVSHNIVTSIDSENPASLSKKVHDILRNVLGFDGVIMTDDLDMAAIGEYTKDDKSAVSAVLAGNDIIVCSDYKGQSEAVVNAVKNGTISEAQINASVARILMWKMKLDII